MTGTFSDELTLEKGRNIIDFINGIVTNITTGKVTTFEHHGSELNIDKVRSLFIYTESDAHVEILGGNIEFDMMSFNKVLRGYDIETIAVVIDHDFVPDKNKFIFVASDNPYFEFDVENAVPHMFYTNSLAGINDDQWYTLFKRHTLGKKFKVKVFNNLGAPHPAPINLQVDIQHREMSEDDEVDQWVSYPNFPMDLVAGDVLEFGDDTSLDTQHHFHRVLVKAKLDAQTGDVDGTMLNI